MFAAGNDGQSIGTGGSTTGVSTVTSPATAKNCISVGATLSTGDQLASSTQYVVYDAALSTGGQQTSTFRVMQASFGGPVSALGASTYRLVLSLVQA